VKIKRRLLNAYSTIQGLPVALVAGIVYLVICYHTKNQRDTVTVWRTNPWARGAVETGMSGRKAVRRRENIK